MKKEKVDIAIISAMPEELEYIATVFSNVNCKTITTNGFDFKIYAYNNVNILVAHSGMGTTFAAIALTLIKSKFDPDYFFLSGTAGSIRKDTEIGDVVIAEKAFEADIQETFKSLKDTPFESCLIHPFNKKDFPSIYSASSELLEISKGINFNDTNVIRGKVVSSNAFPAPIELFNQIKKEDPISIDMETSAFYQTAWLLNVKAIAIRGISNKLCPDGKDENVNSSDIKGASIAAAKIMLKILDRLISLQYNVAHLPQDEIAEVKQLIKKFDLQRHREGGYYAQLYKSKDNVFADDNTKYHGEQRTAGTSIYYLLEKNDFSAWHSLKSDEIWHFYKGSPLKLYVLNPEGTLSSYVLGDPIEVNEARYQIIIPAGKWFAAEVIDKSSFTLVGCTVSPGFEYNDFQLADRSVLVTQFPGHEEIINKFTRVKVEKKASKSLTF